MREIAEKQRRKSTTGEYPSFIPELTCSPEEMLQVFSSSLLGKITETFFRKCEFKDGKIVRIDKTTGKANYFLIENVDYLLSNYNYYLKTEQKKYKDRFLELSRWVISKAVVENDLGGWKSEGKPIPGYKCTGEFYSALINGRGLSIISRLLDFEEKEQYYNIIEKVLNLFEIESDEGGVLKKEGKYYWYLEYSCGNTSPVVLNGFISSLCGLYDLFLIQNEFSKRAEQLFNQGVKSLEDNIQRFELQLPFLKWTRYDDKKLFLATGYYHWIHIGQLKWLYQVTEKEIFKKYAERWENYLRYKPEVKLLEIPYYSYYIWRKRRA